MTSRRKTNLFDVTLSSNTAITPETPPLARPQWGSDDEDCFVASAVPPSTSRAIRSQHTEHSMQSDTPLSKARCTRLTMHAQNMSHEESLASSPENKLADSRKLFDGVVAFIDVIMDYVDYSSTLAHDIVKGGGVRAMRLNANVTHFVFDNGRTTNWESGLRIPNLRKVNSAWVLDCVEKGVLQSTNDTNYVAKYVPPEINLRDYLPSAKRKYIRKVESLHKKRATPLVRSTRVNRRILMSSETGHDAVPATAPSPSITSDADAPSTSKAPPRTARRASHYLALLPMDSSSDASLTTVIRRKNDIGAARPRIRRPSSSSVSSVTVEKPFTKVVTAESRRQSVQQGKTIGVNTSEAALEKQLDSMRLVSPPIVKKKPPMTLRQKAKELFADTSSSSSLASTPLFRRVNDTRDSTPRRRSARIASRQSLLTLSTNRESLNVAQQGRPSSDDFMSTPQLRMVDRIVAQRGRRKEIVLTNMDTPVRAACSLLVDKMGVYRVSAQVTASTSLVVCDQRDPTPNLLYAMVHNCPVVNMKWLYDSRTAGEWLNEEGYLVEEWNSVSDLVRRALRVQSTALVIPREHFNPVYVDDDCHELTQETVVGLCTALGLDITDDPTTAELFISDSADVPPIEHLLVVTTRWLIDSITNGEPMAVENYRPIED